MNIKDVRRGRFKDASWYPKSDTFVLVGGAGGIGSWLTLMLTRAGFIPFVYDFDTIEVHNIGGQLYGTEDVNKPKAEALKELVYRLTGDEINAHNERVTEDTMTNNIVLSAFDNMRARKDMFTSWSKMYGDDPKSIFIDGRLEAEHMQILCVRGGPVNIVADRTIYEEKYLFDDSQVEDAPCTMRQTSHAAAMIAAHMTGFLTNHMSNVIDGDAARAVPFFWEYAIPLDYLEVKQE